MSGEIKEIKRSFSFDFTELTAIAEYLEKQEEKGLRLKEISRRQFVFEKCEPRKIRYTADIYTGSLVKDFVESCKKEGWEFVTIYDYLYIFRTEKEDAIDIVTDEGDKYKAVNDRAFLNPKYYGLYIMVFYFLLRFVIHLIRDTNFALEGEYYTVDWWMSVLCFALFLASFVFGWFDIFLWLYDAKRTLKREGKVKYYNFEDVIKKQNSMVIILAGVVTLIMVIISYIDSGYAYATDRSSYWLCLFIFTVVCISFINFAAFIAQDKSTKRKQILAFIIIFAILLVEPFAVISYNKGKALAEYEKAPIIFEDFGLEGLEYTDDTKVNGTRFAQYYRSRVTYYGRETEGNHDMVLDYEVFVSEYPSVRQKYIDSVLEYNRGLEERLSDMELKITISSIINSKWDVHYHISFGNGRAPKEIAMKDDTVIYISDVDTNGQDFFEVAYEKLSEEKEC